MKELFTSILIGLALIFALAWQATQDTNKCKEIQRERDSLQQMINELDKLYHQQIDSVKENFLQTLK